MGGHHYRLYAETLSWREAEETCQKLGGHLASVHSKAENEFLSGLRQSRIVWLGATDNDKGKVGKWGWTDGSEFKYQNWRAGEPNNAGGEEFFLSFASAQDSQWNDLKDRHPDVHGYPAT